jgi:hypothetical protein
MIAHLRERAKGRPRRRALIDRSTETPRSPAECPYASHSTRTSLRPARAFPRRGEVELTDAELEEIRGMNATAAIVMHYGGDDWSRAQINGLETQFKEMNIEPISTTDVDFDPGKQVSDLETVQARDPDIIVSIPTDPVATADAYKAVAEDGVELVFMDNVPDGFEQGEDYVSVVSADNFGNGVVSAHLMADRLGGQGKVGVVFHNADFFVTRQQLASGGIVQGQRVGCPLQRCEHAQDQVLRPPGVGYRCGAGRNALRWTSPLGALPVGRGRRAVGDSGRDPGRHELVRGMRHGHRIGARRVADRPHQQRADPHGVGVQPANRSCAERSSSWPTPSPARPCAADITTA